MSNFYILFGRLGLNKYKNCTFKGKSDWDGASAARTEIEFENDNKIPPVYDKSFENLNRFATFQRKSFWNQTFKAILLYYKLYKLLR